MSRSSRTEASEVTLSDQDITTDDEGVEEPAEDTISKDSYGLEDIEGEGEDEDQEDSLSGDREGSTMGYPPATELEIGEVLEPEEDDVVHSPMFDIEEAQKRVRDILQTLVLRGVVSEEQQILLQTKYEYLVSALKDVQESQKHQLSIIRRAKDSLQDFCKQERRASLLPSLIRFLPRDDNNLEKPAASSEAKKKEQKTEEEEEEELGAGGEAPNLEENAIALRERFLKQRNQLQILEERTITLNIQKRVLEEELEALKTVKRTLPSVEQVTLEKQSLAKAMVELKAEIQSKKQELSGLEEDMAMQQKGQDWHLMEKAKLDGKVQALTEELENIAHRPTILRTEADRLEKNISDTQAQLVSLQTRCQQRSSRIVKVNHDIDIASRQHREAVYRLSYLKHKIKNREQDITKLLQGTDTLYDQQQFTKNGLENVWRYLQRMEEERHHIHEVEKKVMTERTKAVRLLQKTEMRIKIAQDNVKGLQEMFNEKKFLYDKRPKDKGKNQLYLGQLKKDTFHLREKIFHEGQMRKAVLHQVEMLVRMVDTLYLKQAEANKQKLELMKMMCQKSVEMNEKCRMVMKIRNQVAEVAENISTHQHTVRDNLRQQTELTTLIQVEKDKFITVKSEMNRFSEDLHECHRQLSHMHDQIKLLDNEIENLMVTKISRDKDLQKSNFIMQSAILARDSLRVELGKKKHELTVIRETLRMHQILHRRLGDMLLGIKSQLDIQRNSWESMLVARNQIALELRERNEENCVFLTKYSWNEERMLVGMTDLTLRNEELTRLRTIRNLELRTVQLLKKKYPRVNQMIQDLVKTRSEYNREMTHQSSLEQSLLAVNDPGRTREISHSSSDMAYWKKKTCRLEKMLHRKELQLVEKELVAGQVSRLVSRLHRRIEEGQARGKDQFDKRMNLQWRMTECGRRLRGVVSELAVAEAEARVLGEEVKDGHLILCLAKERLKKGEAPSELLEEHWGSERRRLQNLQREKLLSWKHLVEETRQTLPNGTRTHAVLRPQAYIPGSEGRGLPIPKPYGAFAPFLPPEPSPNLRSMMPSKSRLKEKSDASASKKQGKSSEPKDDDQASASKKRGERGKK